MMMMIPSCSSSSRSGATPTFIPLQLLLCSLLSSSLLLVLLLLLPTATSAAASLEFRIETAMPKGNILDLNFVSRITLPYGPDLYQRSPPQSDTDQPYQGYGFAMGAAESIQYDPIQGYLYSMSDVGYILIVDYLHHQQNNNEEEEEVAAEQQSSGEDEDADNNNNNTTTTTKPSIPPPVLTEFSFPTRDDDLGSIWICPTQGRLFVTRSKANMVDVYSLVDRTDPKTPQLLRSLPTGPNAKSVLASRHDNCDTLVIANTNSGDELDQGSVTIIQNVLSSEGTSEISLKSTTIPLDYNEWDDDYLLTRGLNMPLTKNALEYWDEYSPDADDYDFSTIRQSYKPAIFLEPENLAWNGPDEEELLVNLQENNGLLRINMTDLTAVAVAGYGLKDHSIIPVDVNDKDDDCILKQYPSLFAMRNPDTIQTVKYNDKHYVITANEGSPKDYQDWSEDWRGNDLFEGTDFALHNVLIPKHIFDPSNSSHGHSALFNDVCEDHYPKDLCLPKVRMSVGSNAIDFESNPQHPIFYRMVLFGGRGWSIYELPEDPEDLLKLVFDSGDTMEQNGCQHFPWAHNARADDEFAPIGDDYPNATFWKSLEGDEDARDELRDKNDPEEDGCDDQGDGTPGSCPMSETMDEESEKWGPAIENVIIGQACGRLVAAMAAEKNSIAMLFDITDITAPDLIKVFHLSPASQFKSLGLAYNDGELGEIDPESGVFLTKEESPSGKAGIMWAGTMSGTVSFWEFECKEDEDDVLATKKEEDGVQGASAASSSSSSSSLSTTRYTLSSLGVAMMGGVLALLFGM